MVPSCTGGSVKRILFLRNRIDTPARYNYEINYGWVELGIERNLFVAYDWWVDNIPYIFEFNRFLSSEKIDCIISITSAPRFAHFRAFEWLGVLKNAIVPTILLACDSCYCSWDDPFYQVWDHVLYRMADRDLKYPKHGSFRPWCINLQKYVPVYGGTEIKMIASSSAAYELRQALRLLNQTYVAQRGKHLFRDLTNRAAGLSGKAYIRELQDARALLATASRISPETRAKVLEAAACGTLVITPPTKYLDLYFSEDQVFVFRDGREFVEVCRRVRDMALTDVVKKQREAYEHVAQNHNCTEFIKKCILPTIDMVQASPCPGRRRC